MHSLDKSWFRQVLWNLFQPSHPNGKLSPPAWDRTSVLRKSLWKDPQQICSSPFRPIKHCCFSNFSVKARKMWFFWRKCNPVSWNIYHEQHVIFHKIKTQHLQYMLFRALWQDASLFLGWKITKKSVNLGPHQPAKRELWILTTTKIVEIHLVLQFFFFMARSWNWEFINQIAEHDFACLEYPLGQLFLFTGIRREKENEETKQSLNHAAHWTWHHF